MESYHQPSKTDLKLTINALEGLQIVLCRREYTKILALLTALVKILTTSQRERESFIRLDEKPAFSYLRQKEV